MSAPVKARGPRPPMPTVSPSVRLRRPETPGAMDPGTADVVRARAELGNAAVAAALGNLPKGAEPKPSTWAGRLLLAGQNVVGNQAIAGQAAPAALAPLTPAPAPPRPAPKKPQPAKPAARKTEPQPASAPDKKDLAKDTAPDDRPDKDTRKEKGTGPRSPGADPKFQALKKDVNTKKKTVGASHPPAAAEAGAAQEAAEAPADDQEARGKAAHAEDMDAAQPKEFDKQEFIRAVKKAIADKAPKNLDEADKFGESGKAEEVKTEVQGKVGEGKDASAQDIAETTAAPPEPAPDAKRVVPMAADKVPGKPATPNPAQAAPDQLPPSATDMSAGPDQVNRQMADAQVTDRQLSFQNSREPQFDKAVKEKKTLEAHSETAPKKLRAHEAGELNEVKNTAAARGSAAMSGIHATRVSTGQRVGTGKKGAKKTDEDKRKEVTDLLQQVFDQTKSDVEKILAELDKKVEDQFTTKEKQARDRFTREHEEGMERYKDERYGGPLGWARWTRDLFAGLPEEANRIYEHAKDNYLAAMDLIITEIAGTVETELKRAKDRIAAGRKELKAAVDKLPADLRAIGREAATEFEGKFDELKDTVNDKGTELVDTLATKYTEAVKSVDDEIAAEKEKNKGLVAKAADAIGGAIKAIIELGQMLLGVLRKAVSAIGAILKDPIGFLGNLVTGVGGGLKLFMKNAARHLEGGVLAWLLGTGGAVGLQLPKTFDILGILTLIAMLLGLSWANIRARLARRVPNQALVAAETAVPLVVQVKSRGVAGMWDDLKTRVGDLKKELIGNLVSFLLPTIIIAGITWIVSLFNPASAFIRACKMIIDIIRFIVTNARQIIEFVNAVLDAVLAIARGGTGGVPALVERALARAIPVLIGALAALLGIGGIAGRVKAVFQKIARPVNKAIDWVVKKMADLVKKLWRKIKPKRKRPARPDRPHDRDKPRKPETKKPEDKDVQDRWRKGLRAIRAVSSRSRGKGEETRPLYSSLVSIRNKFKFKEIKATRRGTGWAVYARLNPDNSGNLIPISGKTLLVGEGNLSFTEANLILGRILPGDVTATIYEKKEEKSEETRQRAERLQAQGVTVEFGVDATRLHEDADKKPKFDNIIWMFPHPGGRFSERHLVAAKGATLLRLFFSSAAQRLNPNGKVTVTLRVAKDPEWYIARFKPVEAAQAAGLRLVSGQGFSQADYPDYTHETTEGGESPDVSRGHTFIFTKG
ncbi:Rossmann-like fold-containing protein [Amycolatopsis sp. NPDC049691]|uniref:Rossmann-like fold-containing protein n=1 Tax=Amycolatopsis sp. NPDC049691 TaxID=3155155 RepID=UPI00342ACCA1